jgi:hypothetical protein
MTTRRDPMKGLPVLHATARDLLELVGGAAHALHSVASKKKARFTSFDMTCSCGEVFKVPVSDVAWLALRNVPEEA